MTNSIPQSITRQRSFFETQRTKELSFRKNALKKLRQEIVTREDAICEAIYADFKKPRFESLGTETQLVLGELNLALKNLELWARPESVSSPWLNFPSTDKIYKEPYGTVLIIAPWNYPFQLVFAPLIGALAAGNTAVIKPSEITPNTSRIISEIVTSVFEPEHVLVVEGGIPVSQELLAEKWDYIFFTGSTHVGRIVYESAAKHLCPVTLELGGKNPCIVDKTAAISLAAKRIVWGKFLNAGQTCIAPDYVLVEAEVKDQLVAALKTSIRKAYGADVEASTDFARMVSPQHYAGLKAMLEGSDILFGGETNDADNYLSPTLVDEPDLNSKLMAGEIFGPILPIISYTGAQTLHKYLSHYDKPLSTYVFSKSRSFQKNIINSYSFGGGAINDTMMQYVNKSLPFGGVGASGIGAYHGKNSFDIFSHRKPMVKRGNWIDIPLRYPPYRLSTTLAKQFKRLF